MWLIAYAAKNGIDVRLPGKPDDEPERAYIKSALKNEQILFDLNDALLAADIHWSRHSDIKKVTLTLPKPAPIATAETLEQLAEIGMAAVKHFWFKGYGLDDLNPDYQQDMLAFVTDVLRAARPKIEATIDEFRNKDNELGDRRTTSADQDRYELLDWLNSRIRYTVDVPPAECPTCAKVREAIGGAG